LGFKKYPKPDAPLHTFQGTGVYSRPQDEIALVYQALHPVCRLYMDGAEGGLIFMDGFIIPGAPMNLPHQQKWDTLVKYGKAGKTIPLHRCKKEFMPEWVVNAP